VAIDHTVSLEKARGMRCFRSTRWQSLPVTTREHRTPVVMGACTTTFPITFLAFSDMLVGETTSGGSDTNLLVGEITSGGSDTNCWGFLLPLAERWCS